MFSLWLKPTRISFLDYLIEARQTLHQELHATKKAVIDKWACRYDWSQISGTLAGGSSKRLMSGSLKFVSLPTALNSGTQLGVIITDPGTVMDLTRQYFEDLYSWLPPSSKPKPWLNMPLVIEVHHKVKQDPFIWPVAATIANFRAMLHKENPCPSSGPDGWEK